MYIKWLFSILGAIIPGMLGNRAEWKPTILAGVPFNLPRETVRACGGGVLLLLYLVFVSSCWSSIRLWTGKEIFASFYVSGVSRVNVQRQVKLPGTWPRFSRKPCPRRGQNAEVLWILGTGWGGWSPVGSSAQTAGAAWFGAGLVWIYQARDVSTVEKLCSLESVKRTFNFWALWLL